MSLDLVSRARAFVSSRELITPGDTVLVAVSGGPDSVALLDILYALRDELKISLHVAHLNHRLRGDESEGDAQFVQALSRRMDLPCTIVSRDVKTFAAQSGLSLEEGARAVRYHFFEETSRVLGADKIATGHTLGDQAETVLFRLIRGSGSRGLRGIPALRDGLFIRPLLKIAREEIETYLTERSILFREDASNADLRFTRNRIRACLLPYLKAQYNANILRVLDRTAELLGSEDDFLDQVTSEIFGQILKRRTQNKIVLEAPKMLAHHKALQRRIIRKALSVLSCGAPSCDFEGVDRALDLLRAGAGVLQLRGEMTLQYSGDLLTVRRGGPISFRVPLNLPGMTAVPALGASVVTQILPAGDSLFSPEKLGAKEAAFDLEAIERELVLRSALPGDRFQPYGMEGHKKISDFLIDCKIPRGMRDEVPLLLAGEEIIWIVGWRTSHGSRVTDKTRRILWVTYNSGIDDLPCGRRTMPSALSLFSLWAGNCGKELTVPATDSASCPEVTDPEGL